MKLGITGTHVLLENRGFKIWLRLSCSTAVNIPSGDIMTCVPVRISRSSLASTTGKCLVSLTSSSQLRISLLLTSHFFTVSKQPSSKTKYSLVKAF